MSRTLLIGVGLPALLAFGVGVGYLAMGRATGDSTPPAATAANKHGGHVMPDGQTMPAASTSAGGGDMPGMDMGGGANAKGHGAGGNGADSAAPTTRPRAAVLGAFGLVNGGVLVTAFAWRRRIRTRRAAAS